MELTRDLLLGFIVGNANCVLAEVTILAVVGFVAWQVSRANADRESGRVPAESEEE